MTIERMNVDTAWSLATKLSGSPLYFRDAASWERRGHGPCLFIRGQKGDEVPFHHSIIGRFVAYKDQRETNLLPLFPHP